METLAAHFPEDREFFPNHFPSTGMETVCTATFPEKIALRLVI
jgi:hypothetical protein